MNLENFKSIELNPTQQREINGGEYWTVFNSETNTFYTFNTFAYARQQALIFGGTLRYHPENQITQRA